ncbi:MAG: MerR family transcriptional regulator [Corynebacterium sp.]|nr:MerR family transcriptional regulator [Corynebacterium sp.]
MSEETWSIGEVVAETGVPASTLRYYEKIGILGPIARGMQSKQREYTEDDVSRVHQLACLQALDLSLTQVRTYVAAMQGSTTQDISTMVELFAAQHAKVQAQQRLLAARAAYIDKKREYWRARAAGDEAGAAAVVDEAEALAQHLHAAYKAQQSL